MKKQAQETALVQSVIMAGGSGTRLWPLSRAGYPKQFELDGDRIYVNVPKANHVAVLDRKSMKQTAAWPVAAAKENVPMGFDRTHRRHFIGCEPGKLAVLDAASGVAVAALDISVEPDSIYYDAATAMFVPELKRYCLAVPQTDKQSAELRVNSAGELCCGELNSPRRT